MIRIVIAEDHNALIDGMKLFLKYEEGIQFLGFARNGKELCKLVEKKKPDIVITDIRMPVMDGIEATKELLRIAPTTKVIALTMLNKNRYVNKMLKAGAKGYVLKTSSLNKLLYAIRMVYKGKNYYDPNLSAVTSNTVKIAKKLPLTSRQKEILELIATGKSNWEIATTLCIAKATVETHRKNIIRKLGLKGKGELLRYALKSKYDF